MVDAVTLPLWVQERQLVRTESAVRLAGGG